MMHLYWVALKSIWAKEIHRFMRIWAWLQLHAVHCTGADHDVGDYQRLR